VSPHRLSEAARRNREAWDAKATQYQAEHAAQLNVDEPAWGIWGIPEHELHVLGDVTGKNVLELGCGAAQLSIRLAKRGAHPVGLDNSARQLEHARQLMADADVDFPLVHASAEQVPLPDKSFDIVFCDHGAMSWSDPYSAVPESARLLRHGGRLAFSVTSPIAFLCWSPETDLMEPRLHRPYFGLREHENDDGSIEFRLTYGQWIDLFNAQALVVDALIEPRAPENATSTYWHDSELAWARQWPSDSIWVARKP
jgi:SAM-dependent methyltransferase